MDKPNLCDRLRAAASLCGDGTVADIGTDHALLPIYLVMSGSPRALASDIREGPCNSARANVRKYRLDGKIEVACRPGLDKIEDFSPENILICGMGGEMIASILDASDYPQKSRCRLVLQPQSMQDVLRFHLAANGFRIDCELVVLDSGKYYQLISARYDGIPYELTPAEAKLGAINLARAGKSLSDVDRGWLEFVKNAVSTRLSGMKNALREVDTRSDEALLAKINEILKG